MRAILRILGVAPSAVSREVESYVLVSGAYDAKMSGDSDPAALHRVVTPT